MTEPIITCPHCKTTIRLTESLAAPLIAATRKQFEQQLLQKDEEISRREQGIREKEREIAETRRTLEDRIASQVAAQLTTERSRISAEESRKARLLNATELENKIREISDLHEVLKNREEKLAAAQKIQAE